MISFNPGKLFCSNYSVWLLYLGVITVDQLSSGYLIWHSFFYLARLRRSITVL